MAQKNLFRFLAFFVFFLIPAFSFADVSQYNDRDYGQVSIVDGIGTISTGWGCNGGATASMFGALSLGSGGVMVSDFDHIFDGQVLGVPDLVTYDMTTFGFTYPLVVLHLECSAWDPVLEDYVIHRLEAYYVPATTTPIKTQDSGDLIFGLGVLIFLISGLYGGAVINAMIKRKK